MCLHTYIEYACGHQGAWTVIRCGEYFKALDEYQRTGGQIAGGQPSKYCEPQTPEDIQGVSSGAPCVPCHVPQDLTRWCQKLRNYRVDRA